MLQWFRTLVKQGGGLIMSRTRFGSSQFDPKFHQTGWGYATVTTATNLVTVTVTFPTAMASVPKVILALLGWTASGTPTGPGSFTHGYGSNFSAMATVYNITTTGFIVDVVAPSSFQFGNGSWNGFTWLAEV